MIIPFVSVLLALYGSVADAKHGHVISKHNGEIKADSAVGRNLLQHARRVEGNNNQQDMDMSFLTGYSVKFQGCHHVQQWNDQADDQYDVRIKTKRLVRFRLCPYGDCSADSAGCTTKYGDYVVDMNTFVEAYLNAKEEDDGQMCNDASNTCQGTCNGDANCVKACYSSYGMSWCLNQNYNNRKLDEDFDPLEYAECAEWDAGRRLDQNNGNYYNGNYYIGPYCADQGGEIHLGMFTDETCTSFANGGEQLFYNTMGYALPYADESLVSQLCLSCGSYNDNGNYELNEMCEDIYYLAGKCETRMNVDYPNESSCSYIEGIKIIREDGVIRTSAFKKSKAAAVCIGVFLTVAVLLAGYVYYLRTKLGRAKINLAAASQSLT